MHTTDTHDGTHTTPLAGWDYAKFRWRSSLFSLVTLVDHLYAIHMQARNLLARCIVVVVDWNHAAGA